MSLKNIVAVIVLLIISGCNESVLNYKDSVVVDKPAGESIYGDTVTYSYYIRIKSSTGRYQFKTIVVPKFEYYLFEVGDTIK